MRYHGTPKHNVRAVYHKELGFYDGNPASLDPLPPVESARRWVSLAGGGDKVVAAARDALDAEDYRWVVELAGKAVFDDPGNTAAREVQADALEQLGYQAEWPQWRNLYLTAAQELRTGVQPGGRTNMRAVVASMPPDIFLDFVAVRLNGPKAEHADITINLDLTDPPVPYSIHVRHGVLHHWARHSADPDVSLTLTPSKLIEALTSPALLDAAVTDGTIAVDGDLDAVHRLLALLDTFDPNFNLIEPNPLPGTPP